MEGDEDNRADLFWIRTWGKPFRESWCVTRDNGKSRVDESRISDGGQPNSKRTAESTWKFPGTGRVSRVPGCPAETPNLQPGLKVIAKGSPEIGEPKNEILSRTFSLFKNKKNLIKILLYMIIMLLMFNEQFVGVHSAPAKSTDIAVLSDLSRGLANNRTLRNNGGHQHWLGRKSRKQHQQHQHRQKQQQQQQQEQHQNRVKKPVNKNCKEYDITSRAFLADVIFEGTARSRSRRPSGRSVTFVIHRVLKQKNNLLKPKTQIRLHFGGKGSRKLARVNPLNDCPLNSITTSGNRAMPNLKFGESYYVFADLFGVMNYSARGEPIVVNRRNLKSIRSVLSKNKEKPPRVLGLQDLNMKVTQPLRLSCQVRGRPVPRINWYKDGTSLIPSSHVNVTYYRRNSTIDINSLELKDGGVYECRATSVTGKMAKISAHVNVWKVYNPSTTDSEKSLHIKKCPVDAYCLNGGQCYFIEHLGEHMCECETGFKGARCEIKEVSTLGIKPYICGFNVGYSSYYC